jgi:hypothetical protein
MSSQTDPTISAPAATPAKTPVKKVDVVSAPTVAILVACVLAAMGNSRESALLTWQLPVALVALSLAYVGFQLLRARRSSVGR